MTRLCLVATLGALAGFGMELVHQWAGVWVLEGEASLPLWIPAVYFVGLLAAGLMFRWVESRAARPLQLSTRMLVTEGCAATVLFVCPPLFHTHELGLAAATVAYLATRLVIRRVPGDLLVVVFVMTVDLAVESALSQGAELYRYTTAEHTPLPLWLAPLWGGIALSLRRLFLLAGRQDRSAAELQ